MLHVAVCEDNGSLLADIKEKVQKYLKENNIMALVETYDRSDLLKYDLQEGKYFDILPEELRYKELVEDLLDQEGAAEFLKMLAQGEECGHVPHFP